MQITRFIRGLALMLLAGIANAADGVLTPEQAFPVSATAQGDHVEVSWRIADGYYLIGNKFRFASGTDAIKLGKPELPAGQTRQDPVFGAMNTYTGQVTLKLPIEGSADELVLRTRSQGCKDGDPCFPPHNQTIRIALAAAKPKLASLSQADKAASPLAELSALGASLGLGGGDEDEILSPEQAYQFSAIVKDGRTLSLHWDIAKGTYLYQDKIELSVKGDGVALGSFELPEAELKKDSVKTDGTIGDVMVYHHGIDLELPLLRTSTGATGIELLAKFQGCAERGICYPPMKQTVALDLPAVGNADDAAAVKAAQEAKPAAPATERGPLSEQDEIVNLLTSGNFAWILVKFFGIGLLLSLTPCVFPMIPILSGIIAGQGKDITTQKGFMLSLVYVLAMAITYTIAGIVVALLGANLSAALQQPGWLIGFAAIFVALAMSMFGFYELQLPASLQSKLTEISNRQQGGSYVGVAIMGLLSALIVGPCLAPPLMAVLIVIGQTGDAIIGGSALFVMALGMGVPLLLIGASAGKVLPRAGAWMDSIKAVFGVLMLGVALTMIERLMPTYISEMIILLAWGLLLIGSGIYMGALEPLHAEDGGWKKLWKGLGLAAVIYGATFLVGAAFGGKDTLQPLRGVIAGGGAVAGEQAHVSFKRIKTVADLDRELAAAKAAGKAVMLDFYADWCVYCKDMERKTFPDPTVTGLMGQMVLLQSDVTLNDEADKALQGKLKVPAPPAMIFWDKHGKELHNYRLVGFKGPAEFAAHLEGVLK